MRGDVPFSAHGTVKTLGADSRRWQGRAAAHLTTRGRLPHNCRRVVVRLRWHEPTQAYMTRRLTEGKTKAEIIRCLKRYVAREIYNILCPKVTSASTGQHPAQAA
jgi:hypothetical protein